MKTPVPLKKRRLPAHPDVSSMTLQKIMTLPPQRPTKFKLDRMKSVRRMKNPKLEKMQLATAKIKDADYKVDMYEASKLTAGCALPFVGIHIFQTSTFLKTYNIELEVLEVFS